MADNYQFKDAAGANKTARALDLSGAFANVVTIYAGSDLVGAGNPFPVSFGALPSGSNNIGDVDVLTLPAIPAGTNNIGKVTPQIGGSDVGTTNPVPTMGRIIRPASNEISIATLSGGTPYALGDLLADTATAGSVTPFSWNVGRSTGFIRRVMIRCSRTSLPATLPTFRLHLWTAAPTFAAGDNAAFSASGSASYLGAWDITLNRAFTDGCIGIGGSPNDGVEQNFVIASGTTLYGALTLSPISAGTYTPNHASINEVFTIYPEVHLF